MIFGGPWRFSGGHGAMASSAKLLKCEPSSAAAFRVAAEFLRKRGARRASDLIFRSGWIANRWAAGHAHFQVSKAKQQSHLCRGNGCNPLQRRLR